MSLLVYGMPLRVWWRASGVVWLGFVHAEERISRDGEVHCNGKLENGENATRASLWVTCTKTALAGRREVKLSSAYRSA